jgi:hypothetical protein
MPLSKAFERFNLSSSLSRKRAREINRRRRGRVVDTMHAKLDVLSECIILFILCEGFRWQQQQQQQQNWWRLGRGRWRRR